MVIHAKCAVDLQEAALALLLLLLGLVGVENSADSLLEHGLEASLVQGRALHILDGSNCASHVATLLEGDGSEALLSQTRQGLLVIAKIKLGADQQEGSVGAVVLDLRVPLGANILERGRRDDGEADEEDVGLGVGQRAQTVLQEAVRTGETLS